MILPVGVHQSNVNPQSPAHASLLPSQRITYDGMLWAKDNDGKLVAILSNFQLILTKKPKESGELSPQYALQYDFNNSFLGGTMGGDQTVEIDLLDGSGDVIVKNLLSLNVPRSRCRATRVKEEGFMSFDWEGKNPQRLTARLTAIKGNQKPC
jgi:hypothetical protein